MGLKVDSMPISEYRTRRFYIMRTDALDLFGIRLEKRFTKNQIQEMLDEVGLKNITFSKLILYGCLWDIKNNLCVILLRILFHTYFNNTCKNPCASESLILEIES